jgi:nucleoside-triphosphatase THEP1
MRIIIISGNKQVGKTSFLQTLMAQKGVGGIVTPIVDGKRFFVSNKEILGCMESDSNEACFEVGRYRFSKKAFRSAADQLYDDWLNPTIHSLILDELGPLELMNQGFYGVMRLMLKKDHPKNLVLVIRDGLVDELCSKFGIEAFEYIPFEEKGRLLVLINPQNQADW